MGGSSVDSSGSGDKGRWNLFRKPFNEGVAPHPHHQPNSSVNAGSLDSKINICLSGYPESCTLPSEHKRFFRVGIFKKKSEKNSDFFYKIPTLKVLVANAQATNDR